MVVDTRNFAIDIWFCVTKLPIRGIRVCHPSRFSLDSGGMLEQHVRNYKLFFDLSVHYIFPGFVLTSIMPC